MLNCHTMTRIVFKNLTIPEAGKSIELLELLHGAGRLQHGNPTGKRVSAFCYKTKHKFTT